MHMSRAWCFWGVRRLRQSCNGMSIYPLSPPADRQSIISKEVTLKNFRRTGPDPRMVTKMRREDREYLNPKNIRSLGLDEWNVIKLTGFKEGDGDKIRMFFEPENGNWKSAVERPVTDWEALFSIAGSPDPEELIGEKIWVKLYEHQSKTDIAELAPYEER